MSHQNRAPRHKSTLFGRKLYSGSIGVPPANLALTAANFSPRFLSLDGVTPFKFYKRDTPVLKAAGISCNFADGLMPQTDLGLRLSLIRYAAALTGTLGNVAGSAAFTMTGGALLSEACPGLVVDWTDDAGYQRYATIATVSSDTAGTFSAVTASTGIYAGNTVAKTALPRVSTVYVEDLDTPLWVIPYEAFRRQGPSVALPPQARVRGELKISAPANGEVSSLLQGYSNEDHILSAMFNQDLAAGQILRLGGRTLLVGSVDSQFRATITHLDPATAASVAGIPAAVDGSEALDIDDHMRVLAEMSPTTQTFLTLGTSSDFAGSIATMDAQIEILHNHFEVGHED